MMEPNDKKHICTFTGHRPERLAFPEAEVIAWLKSGILNAINDGYDTFISGMQRGVDLWAAEEVLRLRESGKNVRLVAAVPFRGMEKSWDDDWKKRYKSVIDKSNQVVIISNTLCRAAFFQRNHFMVDHASRLLAVYSGGGGGTLETMNYAEKKKIEVIKYSK